MAIDTSVFIKLNMCIVSNNFVLPYIIMSFQLPSLPRKSTTALKGDMMFFFWAFKIYKANTSYL